MGSSRLNAKGETETMKSYEEGGVVVEEVGPQVWNSETSEWERAVKAKGSYAAQPTTGMVPVVPQIMGTSGTVAPLQTAAAATDNNVGNNFIEVVPGLCNQNGNFDQMRNNIVNLEALKNEIRTTTATSALIHNYNHTKLLLSMHVAKAGTGELTLSVIGELHTVASFVPITTAADTTAAIAPGLPTSNGQSDEGKPPSTTSQTVGVVVPGQFTIRVTHSNSSEWEYYVYYSLLV